MLDDVSRQIPIVRDSENGEYIRASRLTDIFELHEIEEMRCGGHSGRFECPSCGHAVILHARKNSEVSHGHRYHFQHPSGIECQWKGEYQSRGEIYRGVQEGSRHQDMKLLLADTLAQLPDWEVVDVDQRFVFNHDKSQKGKPDLHCRYKGQDVVFEIQLRSERPETIIRRKKLYQGLQWPLVWVSADNSDLVSEAFSEECLETRQVQKDIAFSNRGNWFVFNELLAEHSLKNGYLTLLVRHWTPTVVGNRIEYDWQESLVTPEKLTFDNGDFFYKDFYAQLAVAQEALRDQGKALAVEAIQTEHFPSWQACLSHIKTFWPSIDTLGPDGQWLNQQFRADFLERELALKKWILSFLRSERWRDKEDQGRWDSAADRLSRYPFGFTKDQPVAIFEKLLLILGYTLSPHLGPNTRQYVRSCHYFFDLPKYAPYRALCEKAIALSPYQESINNDKTMLKRSESRVFSPESTDLDALFNWFTSDPLLETDI